MIFSSLFSIAAAMVSIGRVRDFRPFFIPIPFTLVYLVKKLLSSLFRKPTSRGIKLPPPGEPSKYCIVQSEISEPILSASSFTQYPGSITS